MSDPDDPISRSDLPLHERLWLLLSSSLVAVHLREKLEEGRFESVDEYRDVKRKVR